MRISHSVLLASALVVAGSSVAFAQDAEGDAAPAVVIGGFVETDLSVPLTGYGPEDDEVLFGLSEVELDFGITPTDGLVLQTDINFFPTLPSLTAETLFEQAYLDYTFGDSGFFISAGKRNAPVGAELIDSIDRFQISQGQVFQILDPFNFTGAYTGWRSDSVVAMLWVTNNWDLPTTENAATVGGRFDYTFAPGMRAGIASTYGPVTSEDPYLMIDADTGLTFGDLNILAEVNFGTSDSISALGFSGTANYAFTDAVSATFRGDYVKRDVDEVTVLDQASVALAGLLAINDNLRSAIELRAFMPKDQDLYMLGQLQLIGHF
jgi:hypothetical protein